MNPPAMDDPGLPEWIGRATPEELAELRRRWAAALGDAPPPDPDTPPEGRP